MSYVIGVLFLRRRPIELPVVRDCYAKELRKLRKQFIDAGRAELTRLEPDTAAPQTHDSITRPELAELAEPVVASKFKEHPSSKALRQTLKDHDSPVGASLEAAVGLVIQIGLSGDTSAYNPELLGGTISLPDMPGSLPSPGTLDDLAALVTNCTDEELLFARDATRDFSSSLAIPGAAPLLVDQIGVGQTLALANSLSNDNQVSPLLVLSHSYSRCD